MANSSSPLPWQRAIVVMSRAVVAIIVVGVLYWAQAVFIPVALALLITLMLTPATQALQRLGLGRIWSVVTVATVTALALGGLSWFVTLELNLLSRDLPKYAENSYAKSAWLRENRFAVVADQVDAVIHSLTGVPRPENAAPPAKDDASLQRPSWFSLLSTTVLRILEPIGTVGLAGILAVFMLLQREDLRNRFLRLIGRNHLAATTKALDEGVTRVSQYLLMQLIINGTYGLAWGLGLWAIGVQYSLLWGVLAATLRYVPYIGAPLAALFPLALTLVQFESGVPLLLVIALLVVLEFISNNIMEPCLYGRCIGVSEVALLVTATFWAFLWGPIGLILSGPLTVCLLMLGRSVPSLNSLAVLLGDEPALAPPVVYYQRLVAGDREEAKDLVEDHIKENSLESVYDDLMVPALNRLKRGVRRKELGDDDEQLILLTTRELLVELEDKVEVDRQPQSIEQDRLLILGCPARDPADRLGLEMMRQMVSPNRWDMELLSEEMLTAEQIAKVVEQRPSVLCIAALPPDGLTHTRYLCKRLRSQLPNLKIIVGRWGQKSRWKTTEEQCREAGADAVVSTLLEARRQLNEWYPILSASARNGVAAQGV